jgi:hypothetical protein
MVCESGLLAVLLIDARCSLTDPLLRLFGSTTLAEIETKIHFFARRSVRPLSGVALVISCLVCSFSLLRFLFLSFLFFLLFFLLTGAVASLLSIPDSFFLSSACNHFGNHQASLSITMRAQKHHFSLNKQFICGARNNLLVNLQFIHFSRRFSGSFASSEQRGARSCLVCDGGKQQRNVIIISLIFPSR